MNRKEDFKVLISKHLLEKMENLKSKYGENSPEYKSIANQYVYNEAEDTLSSEVNLRHYQADTEVEGAHNVERLYKHHGCVELNYNCFSHCRYCLRSNYGKDGLSEEEMNSIAWYFHDINASEILITGGDPFVTPQRLITFCKILLDIAPNIKIFRIATRTLTQCPELINEKIFMLLENLSRKVRTEVATQINSAFEFDEKVDKVIKKIQSYGITIYSQNVFLKGINDTPSQLISLYEEMRLRGIEAHYLFHAVPMVGTHHLRPTVRKMVECYEQLCNSGQVTGRSKPMLACMTEVGKITLTPFNWLGNENGFVTLKSRYKLEDRLAYNPEWKMPEKAFISDDGYICINYLDGAD